uniref:Ubiquitin-like protease family profile domain-containing protein n=1 Tax=Brassica oleracea var. oleracea TaxID=109376 RepID=A0A0D3AU93_BRAOL
MSESKNPNAVSLKGNFESDFRRFSLIHRSHRRLSLRRYHRRSLHRSAASFLSTVITSGYLSAGYLSAVITVVLSTVLPLPFSPPFCRFLSLHRSADSFLSAVTTPGYLSTDGKKMDIPELPQLKESKLGVFIKFQELGFEWASRLVHYMLGFQLDIKKKYELWSLVGPQPVRFSLLEFENLNGLNCEYIEDLESPHCVVTKELTSFWEMLGVHLEAGSSTQEIIAAFGRCEGWSRDDRKRLVYLAIFTGYIEGRKYSTPTRVSLARLVMELERFENYPWGRVAFKVLMDSVKGRDISGCYTINGFPQALQVWVYIALPELGANYVTGTWVNTKLAVVSPAKKKVVKKNLKEDCPRPWKKARKEAHAEASEEATAEASEEATAVGRSEVTTTVGGLTKEDIKAMLKDVVDAMSEGFETCLKEIKYLSERLEAVEKKVGITTKRKGTSSQNAWTQTRIGTSSQHTTPPPKPTLDLDSLPEDKGPEVPADASFSKDKAPETSLSLVLLDKTQSTVLDLEKEDARYCERRDAALALCRAKSDRTRRLAASQQSPYTENNTAKVIIQNKNLCPGYDPFAKLNKKKLKDLVDWCKMCPDYLTPLDEKPRTSRAWWYQTLQTSLSWLADCHIDAWINVLRKRYDTNPQHFRSERMCFLDHLFAQQWRANYQNWKDSEPDQNGLGRRLPGGAWNYYSGTIPSFFQSNMVWGTYIDDIYAPVNYKDTHWVAMWISIPKRHIVVFDSICSSISPTELDEVMEHFLFMVPYLLVECACSDEERAQYSLEPFTYARPTNIPPAQSGDCGVYALKYIECHALGIEFSKKDFAKANGKSMRDTMAVDIFEELPGAHEFKNNDNLKTWMRMMADRLG